MYAGGQALIGTVLGGMYRLERLLGEGGMGSVFEAQHLRLPRRFAIKLLNPEVLGNKNAFERFQREAEIASALGDPHIVQVFDFNHSEGGVPYMVLELLEGEDLSTRLGRGRLSLGATSHFLKQVASALSVAHRNGIVHRDLNPRNVFLCRVAGRDDFVKVLDFGISKVLDPEHVPTVTGAIMGTPNYMSPEQAQGKQSEIDHRTDIFALGAILYECLTGRRAFEAPTLVGALYQVCHGEPEPLRKLAPEVPPGVEQVIMLALAKAREERPHSVQELCDDFMLACADADVVPAMPDDAPTMALPTNRVHPVTTLGGAASENTGVGLRPHRSRWKWGVLLSVSVAAAVVTIVSLQGGGKHKAAAGAKATNPLPPPSPSLSPSPSPTLSPSPSLARSPLPSPPALAPAPASASASGSSPSPSPSAAASPSPTVAARPKPTPVAAKPKARPRPKPRPSPKASPKPSPKKPDLGPIEDDL